MNKDLNKEINDLTEELTAYCIKIADKKEQK